ncbi:MAG: Flp pilus assembly protein CpaB [Planctomycetaceae bacterium]|nr:Flp pilus assembly protein CpaB [Planctomycetaceae bacterium]
MKPKTLVLLAVAAGCGLVAMLGIQQAMQGGQGASAPKVKVLVAKAEIQPGVQLTDDVVGFQEMSAEAVPEDPVTSFEQYEERSLMYPILAGDIIRQSKLGKKGEFTRSRQIPEGMRVIAIAVNDTQTISGMMRPGDRVDVYVTYQKRGSRGQQTTNTAVLLKYIEVFGTDNKTVSDGASKQQEVKTKVVSLLVDPQQVGIIKLAESKGQLALSWRHPDDDEDVEGGNVDDSLLAELSGLDKVDENDVQSFSNRGPALFDQETAATPEPQENLNNLLDEGEPAGEQPAATPVAVAPAKPTWKVQIYQGDAPVEQEFEVSEAPAAKPETAPAGGEQSVTDAFRWLHQQFTGGEAAAPATTETKETTL